MGFCPLPTTFLFITYICICMYSYKYMSVSILQNFYVLSCTLLMLGSSAQIVHVLSPSMYDFFLFFSLYLIVFAVMAGYLTCLSIKEWWLWYRGQVLGWGSVHLLELSGPHFLFSDVGCLSCFRTLSPKECGEVKQLLHLGFTLE